MGQHEHAGIGGGQRGGQQAVGGHCRPQGRGVVAQFADLGCRLVDDAEHAVNEAHRTRAERRIVAAALQGCGHNGIVAVESVAADQEVQPGRVAPAHLEPVQRRQRLVDRQVGLDRSR